MDAKKHRTTLKRRTLIKYILRTVIGLAAFVLTGISVIVYLIFTPERITPIVMKYANEYMNAQLECASVELTFYSTFPNFGIRLRNGNIINIRDSLSDCPQDTLLRFNDCSVSFDPIALYRKNRLIINHVKIERPVIYAYVNPEGKTNWDILPQDDPDDESTVELPDITVNSVTVANAAVVYDDRRQNLFVTTDSLQISAKGSTTNIDMSLQIKSVTTLYEGKPYVSQLPLALDMHLLCDKLYRQFNIRHSKLSVGIMNFDMDGDVERDATNNRMMMELSFDLHAPDLMSFIPEHITDIRKKLTIPGTFDFSGKVSGYLGNGEYPACSVSIQLKDGAVIDNKIPDKPILQKIEIDCRAEINPSSEDSSYISIKNICLQNDAAKLNVSGTLDNIFTQPFADVRMDGNIDFESLLQYMPLDAAVTAGGSITAEVAGKFFLNDMLAFNIGKLNLAGSIDVDSVRFSYPDEGIALFAPFAKVTMGNRITDSIYGHRVESLLRARIELDSLMFDWKDEFQLNAGKMQTILHTSEPRDSVSIAGMAVYSRLTNLYLKTPDSTQMKATKISALGRLSPLASNPSRPEWAARISMDNVRGRVTNFAGRIDSTVLEMKLHARERRQIRQLTAEDSIRWKSFMDSVAIANRNSYTVDFKLPEGEAKNILSKWNVTGSFTSKSIGMRTPYFPMRIKLSESLIAFADDKLSIQRTNLNIEAANMKLNGEIKGIRGALLHNGRIRANIAVSVDSMDCNRIIRALAAGSAYAVNVEQQDSISRIVLDATMEPEMVGDSISGLFVVPRNIDMELNTSMKHVKYNSLNIEHAAGIITVRNRSIRIPDLKIQSDIGSANLSLAYKAPTTKGAYVGADIHLKQIQIRELIKSLPVLDSLTPMMRSFEGQAECNIIAVTELDSLSNLIIPKTTALCNINGKNMVLLDGETFSSIAKKLYFKNKNRNIIDSVSVDMMLDENIISVFPFVLTIDRYVAAIGGIQNLDLSFEYHISILKWPLQIIKIGLDLWGNPDDIHFRIASRRYADLLTPVKRTSFTSSVINLRQQLHGILRKSIDEILNENPETLSRQTHRISSALGSDSIQSLLKIDTVRDMQSSYIYVSPSGDTLENVDSYIVEEQDTVSL
jgi:hypothetical protein